MAPCPLCVSMNLIGMVPFREATRKRRKQRLEFLHRLIPYMGLGLLLSELLEAQLSCCLVLYYHNALNSRNIAVVLPNEICTMVLRH